MIQTLDKRQTKEIKSILKNPPRGASYPAVKKALIQTFEKTQLEKDAELLGMFCLGDRDPRSVIRLLDGAEDDWAAGRPLNAKVVCEVRPILSLLQ